MANELKLKNAIVVGSLSSDPGTAYNGEMYYNTTTNTIRQYVNSSWQDVASPVGAGANIMLSNLSNPTAINQDLTFNKSNPAIAVGTSTNIQILTNTGNDVSFYFGLSGSLIGTSFGSDVPSLVLNGTTTAGMSAGANAILYNGSSQTGGLWIASIDVNTTSVSTITSAFVQINTGANSGTGGSGDVGISSGTGGTTSGSVSITTGNMAPGGTSGSIMIEPGAPTSGTGTLGDIILRTEATGATSGKIQLQDGSELSPGSVWTLIDTSGSGTWAPSTTGANTALSNLTNPTAVNQDLILNTGAPTTLKTSDTTNTNSEDLTVTSGNVTSGNGNSGNVILSVGTPLGTGTQGNIQFQNGSQGTTGQIWTSTDTSGSGSWAPAPSSGITALTGDVTASGSGSVVATLTATTNSTITTLSGLSLPYSQLTGTPTFANQSLSNLTSPTAINQSLLFNADNTYTIGASGNALNNVETYTVSSAGSLGINSNTGLSPLNIMASVINLTTGFGGPYPHMQFFDTYGNNYGYVGGDGGSPTGYMTVSSGPNAGHLQLVTPPVTGSTNSSDIIIQSGTTVNGNSGNVTIGAGTVSGSGTPGNVVLLGNTYIENGSNIPWGILTPDGALGVNISAGFPGNSGNPGGNLNLFTSNYTFGVNAGNGAGNVNINAGTSNGAGSGNVNITGGGNSTAGNSAGNVSIQGGTSTGTGNGGSISLVSGVAGPGASSGNSSISTASAAGTTDSTGNITLSTGSLTNAGNSTGSVGQINIQPGNSHNASVNGADVTIFGGANSASGANSGGVILLDGNNQAQLTVTPQNGVTVTDDAALQAAQFTSTGNGGRILYAGDGTTPSINWTSPSQITLGTVITLFNSPTDPVSGVTAGGCYFNTTLNKIKVFNGTTWETVTSA